MTFTKIKKGGLLAVAIASLLASPAFAKVTVLGWPGGPEETALRAAADAYNAKPDVTENDKVELLFFNRDGFWDKLQADLAAGSKAFDVNLLATYSIGRYAPFMEPVELSGEAASVYGDSVLKTMYEGQAVWRSDRSLDALHVLSQGPHRGPDEGRRRQSEVCRNI